MYSSIILSTTKSNIRFRFKMIEHICKKKKKTSRGLNICLQINDLIVTSITRLYPISESHILIKH